MACAAWRHGDFGGRAEFAGAGRDRKNLFGERAHQGRRRRGSHAVAGARRRLGSHRRCARRRARDLFSALGGTGQGFRARDARDRRETEARRRKRSSKRRGAFVAALSVVWPDGFAESVEGRVEGTLVWPPRGTKGFGYDPMFLPDGHERTFGEMSSEEKHGLPPRGKGLSHRARAFLKLSEIVLV